MNILDFIIIIILFFYMIHSYKFGFLDEIFTLLIIIISGYLAYRFSPWLIPYLDFLSDKPTVIKIAAIFIIFIISYIIGKIIKEFLLNKINETELNGFDKLFGMILGLAKGLVLISLILLLGSYIQISSVQDLLSTSFFSNRILYIIDKYRYVFTI